MPFLVCRYYNLGNLVLVFGQGGVFSHWSWFYENKLIKTKAQHQLTKNKLAART